MTDKTTNNNKSVKKSNGESRQGKNCRKITEGKNNHTISKSVKQSTYTEVIDGSVGEEQSQDKQLDTTLDSPEVEIVELENEPPLCGKTRYGGKLEETALSKRQEMLLAEAGMKAMLKETAPHALQVVIDIMNDTSTKDDLRVKCATDIIDRVLGKAKQPIDGELSGGIRIQLSAELDEYSK